MVHRNRRIAPRALAACLGLASAAPALALGDLPSVTRIEPDNRGRIVLTVNARLNPVTVTPAAVAVLLPGPDGDIGSADDVPAVIRDVRYDARANTITIDANVNPDVRYSVRVLGTVVRGADGRFLDGEFNGANDVSGNGVQGGDLVFFTRRPAEQIGRITTHAGVIDVRMFPDRTPLTVANFFNYANRGDYDNSFFHRAVTNFVVQGGGFRAVRNFPDITSDPPVRNEPGISNTRGTVAMAKLGGNPNSATNEFFFNLRDNSGNLDVQNGGFTVFGEVLSSDGLRVMDALAAFETFDASGQNSAFDDLPVRDRPAVVERGGNVIPEDLITIERIALLVGVSAAPSQRLINPREIRSLNQNNNDAVVAVFDLSGAQVQDTSFLTVQFGQNRQINSIIIRDPLPRGEIGIYIDGASRVGEIIDERVRQSPTSQARLAFIVSEAPVGTIRINGGISGADLNGFRTPYGNLAEDIDGDGSFQDPLALWIHPTSLASRSITINGPVSGDVILGGGVSAFNAPFRMSDGELVIQRGATVNQTTLPVNLTFFTLDNYGVRSVAPLGIVSAVDWQGDGSRVIRAPSLQTLSVTGRPRDNLPGDFGAGIQLLGEPRPLRNGPRLNAATIAGVIKDGDWQVDGDIGSIVARGGAQRWDTGVTGAVRAITAGRVADSNISAQGPIAIVNAAEIIGGSLSAPNFGSIVTRGIPNQAQGDFTADLEITNTNPAFQALRSLSVAGNLSGQWNTQGIIGAVAARGDANNLNFIHNGSMASFQARVVSASTLQVARVCNSVSVARWDGGNIRGGEYLSIIARGGTDRGGDMRVQITPRYVGTLSLLRGGNFEGAVQVFGISDMLIDGDLRATNITINPNFFDPLRPMRNLVVRNSMVGSTLRAGTTVLNVRVGMMQDSAVYVGAANTLNGFPTSGNQLNFAFALRSLTVQPAAGGPGFINSFVVAPTADLIRIVNPNTNSASPHGVSVGFLRQSITTVADGQTFVRGPRDTSQAIGAYQVRLGLAAP